MAKSPWTKVLISNALLFLFFINAFANDDVIVKSARLIEPFHKNVPYEIDLGEQGKSEIKFDSPWGLPVVEVYIDKEGPFKFLLDTGADLSVLSNELVQKLKLSPSETKKSELITSGQHATIETSLYILQELTLGQALIKHAPFIASNTAEDDFLLLKNLNIVGVLGANIFHDIVLGLHFQEQKITLSLHAENQKEGNKLNLDKGYYIPIVKANVHQADGEKAYHFLIDTGYNGFIKMPICFSEQNNKNKQNQVVSYDIFNEQSGGFIAELDGTLILGDKKIENPLVKYNIGNCERDQKWGLIGTSFLQHQSISIDQKNRNVIIH